MDTTTWTGSRNLDTLVDFIVQGTHSFVLESRSIITFRAKAVPLLHTRLLQRTKSSGAPTLLFLTGAALRVADGIAKLFAKHFKLEEHVRYLKKTKIGSAVGTPGRVGKLLCDTGI